MNLDLSQRMAKEIAGLYPRTTPAQLSEIVRELGAVDAGLYSRVLSEVKKNKSVTTIGYAEITEAIRTLGADKGDALTFATVLWRCQACRHEYQFRYSVTNDMPYLGIHNACPSCFFLPRVIFRMEGNEIFYKGDADTMKVLAEVSRVKDEDGEIVSIIDYHRRQKRDRFNSAKDRESELATLKVKGLLEEVTT